MIDEGKIDKIKAGKPFSVFDVIAISLSIALCIALIAYSCAGRKEGETLIVKQSLEGITHRYSLLENQEIHLKTEKGELLIKIEDGAAWVVTSACRGQDCVFMPAVRYAGESILCVDLRVSITVEGQSNFTPIA